MPSSLPLRRRPSRAISLKFIQSIILSLCAATLLAACTRGSETGLNPGDLAPDFSVTNLLGESVKLSDFRGRPVLLNFWASWCVPCEAEMPAFEKIYSDFKDRGFVIVAVAVDDSLDQIQAFQGRYKLSFPILIDKAGVTKRLYKYSGFPESFLIDKEGRLVMFQDPEDDQPVIRIVGPRDWDNLEVLKRLKFPLGL